MGPPGDPRALSIVTLGPPEAPKRVVEMNANESRGPWGSTETTPKVWGPISPYKRKKPGPPEMALSGPPEAPSSYIA